MKCISIQGYVKNAVLLLLFETVFCCLSAQYQLNNSGFEQWEGADNDLRPIGWNTMNKADGSYSWAADKGQVEPSSDVRIGSRGKKSVRVYARSILGIVVNGNITTGRIHAGSMKASSFDNNNSTRTKEKGFHHTFSGKPDSMTVWVKSDAVDPKQNAYIRAIIHDDFDYSEPPTPECKNHLVGEALIHFQKGTWQRKSIPFHYGAASVSPKYILVAVGTNQIAGKGDKKDAIFLDDFLMIYNPKILLQPLSNTSLKKGDLLELSFQLTGTMSPNNLNVAKNKVIVELSDKNGSFDHPTTIGTVTTDKSGVVTGTIPMSTPTGTAYRIRLVTTNYPMISKDNGVNISIH